MAFDSLQKELQRLLQKNEFPVDLSTAPIAELLSARIEKLDADGGLAQLSFIADERFIHGGGVVQGGILGSMMDMAMAAVILAGLSDGWSIATTNLNIEFLRPAKAGSYVATASVVRKGRSVFFTRADLLGADGKQCASAGATNVLIKAMK